MRRLAVIAGLMLGALGASAAIASPAPNCTWVTRTGPVAPSDLRGKVVYVDFWASWCAPCGQSFPFMNALDREFRDKGLAIIAVDMDEKPDDGKVFLDAHKASFAVASGANAACAKAFAVKAMPSTYLIDRSGNLRETHQGFRPSEAVSLRNSVVKLLSESP